MNISSGSASVGLLAMLVLVWRSCGLLTPVSVFSNLLIFMYQPICQAKQQL